MCSTPAASTGRPRAIRNGRRSPRGFREPRENRSDNEIRTLRSGGPPVPADRLRTIPSRAGAVDVIDTVSLTNVKRVPVEGAVHNVYVTPDGKYAVSGSVGSSIISVIDTATDTVAWTLKETSGIRPMIFTTNPDKSTKQILVQ